MVSTDDATQPRDRLTPESRQALARIQRWVEAAYGPGDTQTDADARPEVDLFVTDPDSVEELARLPLSASSAVFVPDSVRDAVPDVSATVFGYDGEFDPLGGELGFEQMSATIQFETYAAAEYVQLDAATVLALVDQADFDVLSADVETARDSGDFPAYISHPLVSVLDGHPIETAAVPSGPPQRLLLDEQQALRASWDQEPLENGAQQLPGEYSYVGRAAANFFAAETSGWCRRFLFVAHALRRLAPRLSDDTDIHVWGFGAGPEGVGAGEDVNPDQLPPSAVTAPVIVARGDERLVVVPATGAVSRVSEAIATVVHAASNGVSAPPSALRALDVADDQYADFLAALRNRLRF